MSKRKPEARLDQSLFLPREKRQLGLYDIPKDGQKYSIYAPLNNLWQGYAQEILGSDVFRGGPNAAAKLASAELQGAFAEVVKCTCPSRVGIKGIIVRDRKYVLEVVMERNGLKTIPKEGTTFRIKVESPDASDMEKSEPFIFDVLGDQLMLRSADRANRKFKTHFLTTL